MQNLSDVPADFWAFCFYWLPNFLKINFSILLLQEAAGFFLNSTSAKRHQCFFFFFTPPSSFQGLQQHKGMCSLTSPSENYYRKPATKYKLSNQSQSQPHWCWDPEMLSWTKELTAETQLRPTCQHNCFRNNEFLLQRGLLEKCVWLTKIKTPLFLVNMKINSLK